jgi:hypothetical protein
MTKMNFLYSIYLSFYLRRFSFVKDRNTNHHFFSLDYLRFVSAIRIIEFFIIFCLKKNMSNLFVFNLKDILKNDYINMFKLYFC